MSKKILYFCPSFPYPANNGGKVVFINHLNFFKENGFNIHAIFLDVDGHASSAAVAAVSKEGFEKVHIFRREVPRIKSFASILKSLFFFIFNKSPRAFLARYNRELQSFVDILIKKSEYDYVVFDHFTAFAFVPNFKILKSCRSLFIAHNCEAKVIADQQKDQKNLIMKFVYFIEYLKTKRIESRIIGIASSTITISAEDQRELLAFYHKPPIENIPEILPLKPKRWRYIKAKNLLFVGGTDYYPNYEAVDWIVKVLMPELNAIDETISCTIVGNADNYKEKAFAKNVFFTGRISDKELEDFYCSANVFLSPVILGSGIKVKVLTALSYATPVICNMESLHGITYLTDEDIIIISRTLIQETISSIVQILNNEKEQIIRSSKIADAIEKSFKVISKKWTLDEF